MFRATGRKIEAEAALRAATRADPTFAEAWYNLSDLLDEQGRSEAAIDCLRRAVGEAAACESMQTSGESWEAKVAPIDTQPSRPTFAWFRAGSNMRDVSVPITVPVAGGAAAARFRKA
jgi:tetratricopeptide (TPR) repeat protein